MLSLLLLLFYVNISMYRTNKSAEIMSLEQWKNEYQECEEKLKRYNFVVIIIIFY